MRRIITRATDRRGCTSFPLIDAEPTSDPCVWSLALAEKRGTGKLALLRLDSQKQPTELSNNWRVVHSRPTCNLEALGRVRGRQGHKRDKARRVRQWDKDCETKSSLSLRLEP
jgi:hypothetical protein